ncbi:MAG: OmpA family protein [Planctomycetota bacterium]
MSTHSNPTAPAAAPKRGARAFGITLLAAAAGLAGTVGCATPQDVAYTRQVAKEYESQVYDLEKRVNELQRQNSELVERYNRERRSGLVNASADSNLRTRMEDLGERIANLDREMRPIERFDVEGGYLLMIQDRILFDSGSAELGDEGRTALAGLASEIAGAPHGTIFVRGHTDSDPVKKPETLRRFPHGNLQLSAERAVSVGAHLVGETSIPASDVVVMGFGSWKPIGPNSSADAKRLNRRVEIFVSDQGGE